MDIGMEGEVEFSELRRLRGVSAKYIDIPPRVFQCRLACLQPSEFQSDRFGWEPTMTKFKELTFGTTVCAEVCSPISKCRWRSEICNFFFDFQIYSVENGIASVFIYVHDRTVQAILIDEGIARIAEENFMSKVNHDLRVRTQSMKSNQFEDESHAVADEMRVMMPFEELCEVEEPDMSKRHNTVTLKGPKSPLESGIHSCLYASHSQSRKVVIETQSVNSVLLETNPQVRFY